jgi:hypothetical protein
MHFCGTQSRFREDVYAVEDPWNNAHMARSATRIPGIERLQLPEARQAIPRLHTYLRECILDGRIPPGTKGRAG